MKTIASRQNPIVRAFRELADRPDPRGDRLLLDGAHLIREAADSGFAFERLCVSSSHLERETEEGRLAQALERSGVEVIATSDTLLAALSPVRTPSGLIAIAHRRRPMPGSDDIVRSPDALVLVGVDVQEPGNVGALLRVAEAAGASGVVLGGSSANPFSWKALRGSMGSGLRMPVVNGGAATDIVAALRARQVRAVAAVARGGKRPDDAGWRGRVALLVGGEGPGLSESVVAACDERVTIPMSAPVESLNVTVAAAILLYAARRQREEPQGAGVQAKS